MIRATWGDVKADIARVCGASGMPTTDARVMNYANLGTQELMNAGDWPSLIACLRFQISSGRLIVPSEFDRIISLSINGYPVTMQSPWFEYVGEGPDMITSNWGVPPISDTSSVDLLQFLLGALDREETATFEEIPSNGTTYYPIIYGTQDERVGGVRSRIILQGYDVNNMWIRSNDSALGWIDGVSIEINGDTAPYSATTLQSFSAVTAVLKPRTNGYVTLQVSNGSTQTYLCTYAPYDTRPFYRHYWLPGMQSPSATPQQSYNIRARARKRYVPIVSDNDLLIITNTPALQAMMQGIYYRESKDLQNYAAFKAVAVALMQDEAKAYVGKQRQKPIITFGEGTGVRQDGMYIV